MSVAHYNELRVHINHEIECVGYGQCPDCDGSGLEADLGGPGNKVCPTCAGNYLPANVAVECVTCGMVLLDFDHTDDFPAHIDPATIGLYAHDASLATRAPEDVRPMMPDENVELCPGCIDAYRNGIEPGGTACEDKGMVA